MVNMQSLIWIGFILVLIGIAIIIFGLVFSIFQKTRGEETKTELKGGGIIFIGPIPIAFGTDKNSIIFLSVMMVILMLLAYFLFFLENLNFKRH